MKIVRNDHAVDRPLGLRDPHRAIYAGTHLFGHHRRRHIFGYVSEQVVQVNLLLIVRAKRRARLLTDDRDHWHVVHLRIVESSQQMDGARPEVA